jgi:phenylacetate-coenzyme A ligase PaaK-like adenylate-forming protein
MLWSAFKAFREHARNARMTRAQLEALQLQKFRLLVHHVNERSPYYADLIKQRRMPLNSCAPRDFPVLTKKQLMQNFDQIVTDRSITRQRIADFLSRSTDPLELLDHRYHVLHTSGTSGEVGYFVYSQNDWARGIAQGLRRRRNRPRVIGTGGEAMTLADKAVLEEAFGCPASSGYSCTEHLIMGASTPGGQTMILYDDDLIFEFMEDHSLITNLYNYTLPLIRYRMSDILRPVANSTVSPYIEIESLIGRNELVPALTAQQRTDALEALSQRLRQILSQKLMDNVQFEVVVVDQIPPNPRTRKFQLIVNAAV